MNEQLRMLYQEMIVDHNQNPRNHYVMTDATTHREGHNPLCGDRLVVYLQIKEGRVEKASFKGSGCAISQASASLMTEALMGKTLSEVDALFSNFHALLTTGGVPSSTLGKLSVLAGVQAFPARVKCATLAWHTMHAALHEEKALVTTEE